MLTMNNVTKFYMRGDSKILAADCLSTSIKNNDFVAVTGVSGSGKSTFLRICAGLLKPDLGTVEYKGENLYEVGDDRLSEIRRVRTGFIFQDFRLLHEMTVRENICLPMILDGKAPDETHLLELSMRLELNNILNRFPSELSGGQMQRTAIARALIHNPDIVFADEPTGNLDRKNSSVIFELFRQINSKGTAIIVATHDLEMADKLSRRIDLSDGRIISDRILS